MTAKPIKILMIEDNIADVRLAREMLQEAFATEFEFSIADRLGTGIELLRHDHYDIVILDLGLPDSQGLESLRELCRQFPKVPVLVMTGLAEDDVGIIAVKEGAQDYVMKGETDGKLFARNIRYSIERKQILDERDMLIAQLQDALENIKTLKGMVPICAYCKKIRNDKGFWEQIEAYVTEHTGAEFSHGICDECHKKILQDLEKDVGSGT